MIVEEGRTEQENYVQFSSNPDSIIAEYYDRMASHKLLYEENMDYVCTETVKIHNIPLAE